MIFNLSQSSNTKNIFNLLKLFYSLFCYLLDIRKKNTYKFFYTTNIYEKPQIFYILFLPNKIIYKQIFKIYLVNKIDFNFDVQFKSNYSLKS